MFIEAEAIVHGKHKVVSLGVDRIVAIEPVDAADVEDMGTDEERTLVFLNGKKQYTLAEGYEEFTKRLEGLTDVVRIPKLKSTGD